MKKIRLANRYGTFVHLERTGSRAFKLCGDLQYLSITGEHDDIKAVDPAGGPFIAVGGKVAGMEVESIRDDGENIYIYVKEKQNISNIAMKGKDYLEIRKKQYELLSKIDDSTPVDDPKIKGLLSLQEECDEFEREHVHVGYDELNVELDIKTIVRVIRMAHEEGMNASDFVSMVLEEYMDATEELTWTTNLINPEDYNGRGYPVIIPESAMKERGWKVGDFVRVTLTEDMLTVKNLHIE